jgi:hypothetical protein
MKKQLLVSFLIVISLITVYGQAPEKMNYQGVLRNSSGELMENSVIGLRISLLEGSDAGITVFSEIHSVNTDGYGRFAIQIGTGIIESGNFSTVDWAYGTIYLKTEVDETGSNNYTELSTVQLVTVPYALYANDVANKDDADADPANEIQDLDLNNNVLTITNNSSATQINLASYQGTNTDEQQLSLNGTDLSISGGNTVDLNPILDSCNWENNTNAIYYNSGNVGIGTSTPSSKLEVRADDSFGATDTLFSVKDKDGNVVFAVYPEGAQVFVNTGQKGRLGGFAVSGRGTTKGEVNYMEVTPDSTRIYVNENAAKGSIGGFAVSGRNPGKGIVTDYFNISGSNAVKIIDPSEARILWYPKKEAFLVGKVLIESPDSVGTNSFASGFESKSIGNYSQALGYSSVARGDYSTAIGNYANANANNSFAFGDSAIANNLDCFALGFGAQANASGSYAFGSAVTTGAGSYAFGSAARDTLGNIIVGGAETTASGESSFAIGLGSQSTNLGAITIGASNTASGEWSVAIGYDNNASANYSVVGGGRFCTASGGYSTLSGGSNNTASNLYATVSGGGNNEASGSKSTISGGYTNSASGHSSTISGGSANKTTNTCATVSGGSENTADYYSSIGGGSYNLADGNHSTIGGGTFNTASGTHNSIGGGIKNTATGIGNTVGGGEKNSTKGNYSTVVGGYKNTADANNSTVGGGRENIAEGVFSWVGGKYMHTDAQAPHTFVWGWSDVDNSVSVADAFLIFPYGNTGKVGINTKEPRHELDVNGDMIADSVIVTDFQMANGAGTNRIFTSDTAGNASWQDPTWISGVGDIYYNLGNVGIGTDVIDYMLEVNGDAGKIGGGSWSNSSDLRLKNIHGNYEKGLNEILKLQPILFNYKKLNARNLPSENTEIGFVAQDVQKVFPEAVSEGKDGYLDFNMHAINVAYVNAFKELNQKSKIQQQEIEQLKSENEILKHKLDEILKMLQN